MSEGTEGVSTNIIGKVMFVYGPYAFSLVSLILIWVSIVSPTLERQHIDFTRHELLLDKVRELSGDQLESSRAIERTVTILEALVKRLEK